MRLSLLLACACSLPGAFAADWPPETVQPQKTISVQMPGATAAFSLDPGIVEADAANGVIQLHGIAPGTTSVIVVEPAGSLSITVTVPEPRRSNGRGGPLQAGEREAVESGSYEARYASEPQQFTNALDLRRQEGDSFRRLQIVNSNYFGSSLGVSPIGFPLLSYEIGNPIRDLTFVDRVVADSPLTVNGPTVRGFHLREGAWELHIGFTSLATFQNYLLTTDPEYVAGLTRRFKLSLNSVLSASVYYFRNPSKENAVAASGAAGSLLYAYKPKRNLSAFAEAGAGRSLAFAAGLEYGNRMTHLSAHFKYRPSSYPSLAIDNQHGVFSDLDFSRIVTKRLTVTARVDQDSFNLPIYRQDTLTASGNATVKVTHNLSVQGGVIFSDFKSSFPTRFSLQTTSGLTGVDFTSRHISAGAQYLPTVDSTNRLANGYSANLAGLLGRFQVSANYRHSVDLPTLVSLFSAVPGLQDALARTGVLISDPQQLQQFLANNAFLQTLGYTGNLNLNFAPARDDLGLNVDWAGNGTNQQRVSLSLLNSQTQLVTSNLNFRTGTLGYSRRLGFNNELIASLSAFQTRQGPTSTFTPVVQISFRHRFSAVPAGLLGGRHGNISGHVFHDDDAERHYPGIESGMAGVEVRLDERTSTRTDSEGYFEFRRVPYGFHTVQAKITDPRPYFFTTDSPATAAIDSVVDIGVSFVRGRLFGYIRNDAGGGIPGVELLLTGPAASRRIQAAFDGKFSVDGVAEGEYSLSTIAESYPDGYNLLGLPVQQVAVKVDRPSPVILVARALRSVSGSVSTHDPQTLAPTPLANAIVTIPELSRSARADKSGKYLFRDLPAGTFTIQVEHQGETVSHTVDLPGEPIVISNVDFSLRQRPN